MDNKKWGPGKFISNLMGKNEGSVSEVVENSGDPLNEWHQEGTIKNEGFEPTEDDLLALEHDSKYQLWKEGEWKNLEDLSQEEAALENFVHSYHEDDSQDDFENQDLSQLWKKTAERKLEAEESVEEPGTHTAFEFSIMKRCANYVKEAWYRKNKSVQRPTFADGQRMSDASIKELFEEYKDFENTNPQEFANMKVESGDWKKHDFVWEKSQRDGKDQWKSFEPGNLFLSNKNPEQFLHDGGEYYFTSSGKPFRSGNVDMHWIDLQMPAKKEKAQ